MAAPVGGIGVASSSGASELRLRILSSIVLAILVLGATWAGGAFVGVVWLVAAVAVALEWMTMTGVGRAPVLKAVAAAALAGAVVAIMLGAALAMAAILAASAIAVLVVATSARDRAWALGGLAYAVPIALVPVVLRLQGPAGTVGLLWMFAIVWTTDIAAYFTGRSLGGPKLWPAVSPKKTWSGFLGGLLGGMLAGLAVALAADRWSDLRVAGAGGILLASAIASIASQVGDLGESAMKRKFGVKDSGTLIPGHGGFMDRLDGFAAVAAVVGILILVAALRRSAAA